MPTSGASSALLIHVSGHDKPGLTHALTSILGRHNVRVLDIGQAVIHDGLALGILIELTDEMRSSALLTDLLLEAHSLGVTIKFSASSAEEYDAWVESQSKQRFIITLLGPVIDAAHIAGNFQFFVSEAKNEVITDSTPAKTAVITGTFNLKNPN